MATPGTPEGSPWGPSFGHSHVVSRLSREDVCAIYGHIPHPIVFDPFAAAHCSVQSYFLFLGWALNAYTCQDIPSDVFIPEPQAWGVSSLPGGKVGVVYQGLGNYEAGVRVFVSLRCE